MSELIYNPADTICAISTPPGVGGIAVIRLSGTDALDIAAKVWHGKDLRAVDSHTVHLGTICFNGKAIDQGVATVFRAPASYTGDDTVEFSVHGSRWIQREVLKSLTEAGARMALPGEFTRRACVAGHLDLAQAEAVADLIAADGRAAHDTALRQLRGGVSRRLGALRARLLKFASLIELELDFSDQDVEFVARKDLIRLGEDINAEIVKLLEGFQTGAAVKDGFPIAIIGAANAGKSALLNAILDDDRAIVSDIPGTTRDIVEDRREVGDYTVRFLDTAGLRSTDDSIERLGIERTHRAAAEAAVVIYVADATALRSEDTIRQDISDIHAAPIVPVINKTDIATASQIKAAEAVIAKVMSDTPFKAICISATCHTNIDALLSSIESYFSRQYNGDDILITSARHAEALANAQKSNLRALQALHDGIPADLIAQDLRLTLHHLASITDPIATPEILNTIFSTFCIGK